MFPEKCGETDWEMAACVIKEAAHDALKFASLCSRHETTTI